MGKSPRFVCRVFQCHELCTEAFLQSIGLGFQLRGCWASSASELEAGEGVFSGVLSRVFSRLLSGVFPRGRTTFREPLSTGTTQVLTAHTCYRD